MNGTSFALVNSAFSNTHIKVPGWESVERQGLHPLNPRTAFSNNNKNLML